MKTGRVVWNGAEHSVTPFNDEFVSLADGRVVSNQEVQWLCPFEPRTIFVLALNYADHAKELDFKKPKEPIAFIKPASTVIGHRSLTRRPADVTFMHYECELAVVIGKQGRHITKESALDYVKGYTVANDYALRDYLENYYRPNLRVKGRDGCTPIGPWLVDQADIADPQNLQLVTRVNGVETQRGTTAEMIFDVSTLIAWFSSFMTLSPGDVILTGTPVGPIDVKPGDVVETEVEGIGCLVNTIVSDTEFYSSVPNKRNQRDKS